MDKDKLIILGHDNPDVDSIISGILLEYYINHHTPYHGEFVIPDKALDKETISICDKFKIDYKKYQRPLRQNDKLIILVDHHERTIKNTEIIAILDHHPTTKENSCSIYINQKISSTAALITQKREDFFPKDLLRLSLLATYVDTASFNSTKSRQEDKIWAEKLIKKLNFDEKELYEAGLSLTDISDLETAAFNGLKSYIIADKKVEVSTIQIKSNEVEKEVIEKIKKIVLNYFIDKNLDIYILLIHDMEKMKSTAYKIFKDKIEIVEYPQYTSRGNTIIPNLEEEISKSQNKEFKKMLESSKK